MYPRFIVSARSLGSNDTPPIFLAAAEDERAETSCEVLSVFNFDRRGGWAARTSPRIERCPMGAERVGGGSVPTGGLLNDTRSSK